VYDETGSLQDCEELEGFGGGGGGGFSELYRWGFWGRGTGFGRRPAEQQTVGH
jgi:hypothetical protein